jgi:hypothetical protein
MDIRTTTVAIVAITTLAGAPSALAGDLTPPGAPAPTMKPLAQVEPRVPITAADMPLTISQPGSYYFVENITASGGGISIQSDDVTIDLSGFSFRGGTGNAIGSGAFSNITIRNGTIGNWGSGGGIVIPSTSGAVVENIQVRDVFVQGIWTGEASLIRDCTVVRAVGIGSTGNFALAADEGSRIVNSVSRDSGGGGIWVNGSQGFVEGCTATQSAGAGFQLGESSSMSNCRAVDNGDDGVVAEIGSTIMDSVSFSNDQAGIDAATGVVMTRVNVRGNLVGGIDAGDACTITDSTIYANFGIGVSMVSGGSIIGCNVNQSTGDNISASGALIKDNTVRDGFADGIQISTNCTVIGNQVSGNGSVGIRESSGIVGGFNRIEGNHSVGNGSTAISVSGVANAIVRNTADSYGFAPPPANQAGDIVSDPGVAEAWDNIVLLLPPS